MHFRSAVERLSRFPDDGERTPAQWYLDAAQTGDAGPLELSSADRAVEALQTLPPEVAVSLNVSPAVAVTPAFVAWLAVAPVRRLVLELTEHAQVHDYELLRAALAPARAAGLRVAVDDAGAGYASLRHSLLIEPDLLKLDISLVRGLDTDERRRALCRAVVAFAHSTGARVVAEGVETDGELEALRRLRVDLAQGYVLQRPVPLAELRLTGLGSTAPGRRSRREPVSPRTLQTMHEMAQSGCSPATIAARLNQLGEPAPGGLRWRQSSVAQALLAGR